MLAIGNNLASKVFPCTSQMLEQILEDKDGTLAKSCEKYQNLKRELVSLKHAGKDELAKEKEAAIDKVKQTHPVGCYLGHYLEGHRIGENLLPNGLYFIDIDLKDNPEALKDGPWELDKRIREQDPEFYNKNVVFAHVSWSKTGLRYVVKCNHSMTYLENQQWFCDHFGVKMDEQCKDLARASFLPTRDLILVMTEEFFTYNNPLTNEEFGGSNEDTSVRLWYDGGASKQSPVKTKGKVTSPKVERALAQGAMKDVKRDEEGFALYRKSIRYTEIGAKLMDELGGIPESGERANTLLEWAKHFHHICDNDVDFMHEIVKPFSNGLSDREIKHQMESGLTYYNGLRMTNLMRKVLRENFSTEMKKYEDEDEDLIDYEYFNKRLSEIRLPKGLKETVMGVPEKLRLGALMAAMPCIYTHLSRVSALFCNHEIIRMNGMTMWVGNSTIGKRHLKNVCNLWLSNLKEQDKASRKKEADWKEERDRIGQNKQMTTKRPQPIVRVVPSNITAAMLNTRLYNAWEMVPTLTQEGREGPCEEMHLHLMTVESDMHVLEITFKKNYNDHISYMLKGFDNEEMGNECKYDQSTNGPVNVYWNWSMAGTWESFWHMMSPLIGTGMEFRLMIYPAPSNYFQKEEISKFFEHPEWEDNIREVAEQIGGAKPFYGLVYCPELIREMEEWCNEKLDIASESHDKFYDTLRKRDRQKAFLAGLAFAILEQRDKFLNLPIVQLKNRMFAFKMRPSKNTIKFARLFGDLLVACEMATLKDEVAVKEQKSKGAPRKLQMNFKTYTNETMEQFNRLPDSFTKKEANEVLKDVPSNTVKQKLKRWKKDGLLNLDNKTGVYKKTDKKMMREAG